MITNDLNPDYSTDYCMDALDFLKKFDDDEVDLVLFDPPYSLRQLKECYDGVGVSMTHRESQRFWYDLKDEVSRITKPGGTVLSFGWSTVGMAKSRGFEIADVLLVCHGGMHNDTICVREKKVVQR
jgi:DNA modification methylase